MWRAMNSLLVLRNQVNVIAPNRSRASDGLVGDEAHQDENSDHNPHYVPGVGSEIVTALDLTHDPAHGFDSYFFAEILRQHRDRRIKYVISNHRIFSSYNVSTRPAWVWGSYNGSDPHTNHVHVSVLDATISDTNTPWDLEGLVPLTDDDVRKIWAYFLGASGPNAALALQQAYQRSGEAAANSKAVEFQVPDNLTARLDAQDKKLNDLADAIAAIGTPPPAVVDNAAIAEAVADELHRRTES